MNFDEDNLIRYALCFVETLLSLGCPLESIKKVFDPRMVEKYGEIYERSKR